MCPFSMRQPVSPITAMRSALTRGSGSAAPSIAASMASVGTVASQVSTGKAGGAGAARTCIATTRPSTSSVGQLASLVIARAMRSPSGPSCSQA